MIERGREAASREGGMTSEVTFGIKVGKSASCGEEGAAIVGAGASRSLGKISGNKSRKE